MVRQTLKINLACLALCQGTSSLYHRRMNQLLQRAVEAVEKLPAEDQNEIARLMLDLAREDTPESIDPAHLAGVLEGLEQARRGEFATEEEITETFRNFGA